MTGTAWISLTLYSFRRTPFLTRLKREVLSSYALPIGVLAMIFANLKWFSGIPSIRSNHIYRAKMRYLEETFTYDENASVITMTRFWEMPLAAHGVSAALGFPLAILFFMDQLIVTKTVDNTQNK